MHLKLNPFERRCLEQVARGSVDSRPVKRAQALLAIDAGQSPQYVAAKYKVARSTIYNWISRGRKRGFTYDGLCDSPRPGRPRVSLRRQSRHDSQNDIESRD